MSESQDQKPNKWRWLKKLAIHSLFYIGSCIFALISFPLLVPKVKQFLPEITTTGWLILFGVFVITTAVGIKIAEVLEKRLGWSEDRATLTVIFIFFGIIFLTASRYWPWLEPWFGTPAQQ